MADAIYKIDIARQFSKFPAGRFYEDGPFSGQAFREKFLLPALNAGKSISVLLDDTAGFGSSFLEEAFGGLIRAGWSAEKLKRAMTLECSDASVLEEVALYIRNAEKGNG